MAEALDKETKLHKKRTGILNGFSNLGQHICYYNTIHTQGCSSLVLVLFD